MVKFSVVFCFSRFARPGLPRLIRCLSTRVSSCQLVSTSHALVLFDFSARRTRRETVRGLYWHCGACFWPSYLRQHPRLNEATVRDPGAHWRTGRLLAVPRPRSGLGDTVLTSTHAVYNQLNLQSELIPLSQLLLPLRAHSVHLPQANTGCQGVFVSQTCPRKGRCHWGSSRRR